jgi:hypothetical protein
VFRLLLCAIATIFRPRALLIAENPCLRLVGAAPYTPGESLGNAKDSRPYFCALQREIFLALSGIFATCGTLSLAAESAHSWNTVFSKDAVAGERHRVIFSSRCCRETCFSRRAGFFRPSSSTTRSRVPSAGIALCSLMPQSPCCVWSVATLIDRRS